METSEEPKEEALRKFLRQHRKIALMMIAVIAGATIVAAFTFLKVVADAQVLGLVPVALGQWTVGYIFTFILQVIFWELVFVASWAIPILVVIFVLWYRKLPEEERQEYGLSPKRGADPRRTEGGGFISFLIGVVWLIIVWFTGRWNLAFQAWTFNDWVYTGLAACLWVLLPLVIAGTIYLIWVMLK
ncbi:MAG: hypothetical protein ACFE89_01200 [Candidatus Hodarchaeota archaeon]